MRAALLDVSHPGVAMVERRALEPRGLRRGVVSIAYCD